MQTLCASPTPAAKSITAEHKQQESTTSSICQQGPKSQLISFTASSDELCKNAVEVLLWVMWDTRWTFVRLSWATRDRLWKAKKRIDLCLEWNMFSPLCLCWLCVPGSTVQMFSSYVPSNLFHYILNSSKIWLNILKEKETVFHMKAEIKYPDDCLVHVVLERNFKKDKHMATKRETISQWID